MLQPSHPATALLREARDRWLGALDLRFLDENACTIGSRRGRAERRDWVTDSVCGNEKPVIADIKRTEM
jgi:hypothetical protein